jgi:hypothetical protein
VPITYAGNLTVAATLPGLASLSAALDSLKKVVDLQSTTLATAHASIKLVALADISAQLDASLQVSASLQANIQDPASYLAALVSGIAQLTVNINALVPALALAGQLSANLSVTAELSAKKAAITAAIDALLAIQAALNVALNAAVNISVGFLDSAGVHVFLFTGPLANLGTEVDAFVSVNSGISGSTAVRVPVLVVETSNGGTVAALQAILAKA